MASRAATAIRIVAAIIGGFAVASSGWAATAAANLTVAATVTQKCKITVTDVVFGSYDPVATNFSTALVASSPGSLVVTCTKNASGVALALDFGRNSSGGTNRRMLGTGGSAMYLAYQLYQPSAATPGAACAYSTIWGDSTSGSVLTPAGTNWGSMAANTFSVCGTAGPAGQDVEPGWYADVVTATVNF